MKSNRRAGVGVWMLMILCSLLVFTGCVSTAKKAGKTAVKTTAQGAKAGVGAASKGVKSAGGAVVGGNRSPRDK